MGGGEALADVGKSGISGILLSGGGDGDGSHSVINEHSLRVEALARRSKLGTRRNIHPWFARPQRPSAVGRRMGLRLLRRCLAWGMIRDDVLGEVVQGVAAGERGQSSEVPSLLPPLGFDQPLP